MGRRTIPFPSIALRIIREEKIIHIVIILRKRILPFCRHDLRFVNTHPGNVYIIPFTVNLHLIPCMRATYSHPCEIFTRDILSVQ